MIPCKRYAPFLRITPMQMITETAWIVKRIFEPSNAGFGAHKIAKLFQKEQIPSPSWWQYSRGEKDYSKRFENPENKYDWSHMDIVDKEIIYA